MVRLLLILSTALILLFLPLRLVLAQITPGDILFIDDFSSGSLGSWIIETGNWHIQDGQLVGSGYGRALGGRTGTGNTEWDNYIYEIDVLNKNGIDEGIGFRRADGGANSYEVIVRHGTGAYNTPEIILAKVENSQLHILYDTHRIPLINNQTYHFKFAADKEHLQGWVNNILIYDLVDTGTKVKKGPISLSYNSGDFGIAEVYFDNVKVTSLNPPTSPSPTPTPSGKTPLIFIPGIAGSELKVTEDTPWVTDNGHGGIFTHVYNKDEKIWVNELEALKPGDDDYFDILRLTPEGKESAAKIEPNGEIVARAYQKTIDYFINQGYVLNQDLFVLGYDWRKDLNITTSDLSTKISEVRQKTHSEKVNLVTHSMGGLLARNYIKDPQMAQNVNKLVTIAPPFLGSPKSLKSIMYGDCLFGEIGSFCISLNQAELKDITQNLSTMYQLFPSKKYYSFYDVTTAFKDERDIDNNNITGSLDYDQTKQLLTNLGYNTKLYSPAEAFHVIDNNLANTNGVNTAIIAGSGQATLGQIIEKYKYSFTGNKVPTKDAVMINGDETVPLFSASLNDSNRSLSLFDANKVFYTKNTHGSITSDKSVLEFVHNILNNSTDIPDGISKSPFPFKGKQYSGHSPINLHAYDTKGNHTGPTPDGGFETNIPGSSYETIDDAKFIFLPDEGVYQLKIDATDQGDFDFKIRTFDQNKIIDTKVYKDIPLTKATKAQVFIDDNSQNPPILNVDEDGDGVNDFTYYKPSESVSGELAADQTAPATDIHIEGSKGLNDWYTSDIKISLSANDNTNGSGIAQILYSLDEGKTINIYNQPIIITEEGVKKLRVKAIDNAGNEEPMQEVNLKIDKTAPEAKIMFNLTTQDFDFTGNDNLTQTQVKETSNLITITDEAGNKIVLILTSTEQTRREKISLKSISYNDKNPIALTENLISAVYKLDKNKDMIDLIQRVVIKGEEHLYTNYDPKTDKTRINIKKPKSKKTTDEKSGKVLLFVTTKRGELDVDY